MDNRLPVNGHWAAVDEAVRLRLDNLGWSAARLCRESGISEPTIRYIKNPRRRDRSTLVALSASLGYPHDYLVDVCLGVADPRVPPPSPAEMAFIRNLMRSEVGPLKQMMETIDGKVTTLLSRPER